MLTVSTEACTVRDTFWRARRRAHVQNSPQLLAWLCASRRKLQEVSFSWPHMGLSTFGNLVCFSRGLSPHSWVDQPHQSTGQSLGVTLLTNAAIGYLGLTLLLLEWGC